MFFYKFSKWKYAITEKTLKQSKMVMRIINRLRKRRYCEPLVYFLLLLIFAFWFINFLLKLKKIKEFIHTLLLGRTLYIFWHPFFDVTLLYMAQTGHRSLLPICSLQLGPTFAALQLLRKRKHKKSYLSRDHHIMG